MIRYCLLSAVRLDAVVGSWTHIQMDTRYNVLICPYESAWVGGPDLGCIPAYGRKTQCGNYEDDFPDRLKGQTAPEVAGRYLYGGPLKVHFGHVMIDSVIRLWADDPAQYDGVVFPRLFEPPGAVPGWVFEIFRLYGLERNRVIPVESPTVFECIDFAEPGSQLGQGPAPWYLDWLRQLPINTDGESTGDLFLGRQHMIERGTLMGESYFAGLLADAGFTYFRPEQHDIVTQASTLARADRIVFTEGSGIYSVELLAGMRGEAVMLPRRNGGVKLFGPHLERRAQRFRVLGYHRSLRRLTNVRGRQRPDSPSYTLAPKRIASDLRQWDIVGSVPFSMDDFEAAEQRDVEIYFASHPELAAEQLAHIRALRSAIR